MDNMDRNPLFESHGSASDSSDEESFTGAANLAVPTPPAAVLQTVNIRSYVPVVLSLANANYDEWRCFMDAFLGMFSLTDHVTEPPTAAQCRDHD
jgi:hypothetical protein